MSFSIYSDNITYSVLKEGQTSASKLTSTVTLCGYICFYSWIFSFPNLTILLVDEFVEIEMGFIVESNVFDKTFNLLFSRYAPFYELPSFFVVCWFQFL